MLSPIQIHLALNHVPLVALIIGFLTIGAGQALNQAVVRRVGLAILVFGAVLSVGAYLSGDEAEHSLRAFSPADFPREAIHAHEERAEAGFIVTLASGASALVGLWAAKTGSAVWEKRALVLAGLLAVGAIGILGSAAHLGGLIRHPELR